MDVTKVCMSSKNECIQRCASQEYGLIKHIDDHFDYVLISQKSLLILDDDDVSIIDAYYFRPTTIEIVTKRYETINVCLNNLNLFGADVQSIIFLFYGCLQDEIKECVDYEDDNEDDNEDWCEIKECVDNEDDNEDDRNGNHDIVKYSHSDAHVSGFECVDHIYHIQTDSGYLYISSSDTADDNAIFDWEIVGQCKQKSLGLIEISRSTSELSDTCYISNTSTTKMTDL